MNTNYDILPLILAKGLGSRSLDRILSLLGSMRYSISDFISAPITEMTNKFGIKVDIAYSIKNARESAMILSEKLEKESINILVKGDNCYPSKIIESLKDTMPPILFVKGNTSLLFRKSIGFCGSRKVSEKGLKIAEESALKLSQMEYTIVSGYAKGVDIITHKTALYANGSTVIVLAEGIFHFKMKSDIKEYFNNENTLIVSEFLPQIPWKAHNAMTRNRTICGLSDALVLIESGLSGGTFEAGKTALELNKPLFVVDYAHPTASSEGNKYFLDKGAFALRGDKNGHPNINRLVDLVGNKMLNSGNNFTQTSLFNNS